jgi:Ca2+-binding RTX toxin-like protein
MPIRDTDSIVTAGHALTYSASSEVWTILEGVTVATSAAFSAGVFSNQLGSVLNNYGLVVSDSSAAVAMNQTGGRVINGDTGVISGATGATLGGTSVVHNAGQITGWNAFGLVFGVGGELFNTGTIAGDEAGVFHDDDAIGELIVHNSGVIRGYVYAIRADGATSDLIVENSGDIFGLVSSFSDLTLRNSGLISGNVSTNAAYDTVVNSGEILGQVLLSGGNDIYRGRGGLADGEIDGGGGDDLLVGGQEDDDLYGRDGRDTLRGGGGEDTIYGGTGGDRLAGGAGRDIFLYLSRAESSVGTNRDTILDFGDGDVIDLSAIDADTTSANNAFVFIGSANFSAAGQLRYDNAFLNGSLLQGDVNGDGVADFNIFLQGVFSLTYADFVP